MAQLEGSYHQVADRLNGSIGVLTRSIKKSMRG